MSDAPVSQFRERFVAAIKRAREPLFTQAQIAELLGIAQDTYKQYETRSLLPHHLIPKFCIACRISTDELYESAKLPVTAGKKRRSGTTKAA